MRPLTRPLCLTLTLVALAAPAGRAGEPADPRALAEGARAALKTYCSRCHHGPGSEGGDFDVLRHPSLTASRDGDKPYVVAGKPGESLLLRRMEKGLKQEPGSMPPRKEQPRPAAADVAAVRNWVEAGAPPFPEGGGRPFVSTADVLAAIRDHLRATDRRERHHQRFFTLEHLHNNPAVSEADLRVHRAALAKAVNSLSNKRALAPVRRVDKAGTVYAVDVSLLDWDRGDLWLEVLRAYPYGLKYAHHPDPKLRELDDEAREMSGCPLPYVRADWFVATATRPPLYHTLLQLPRQARELEQRLGVDVRADFLGAAEGNPRRVARAGFAKSGVSAQNRLVERHEGTYGAYWKSYDFKPGRARGTLTRFPLGPLNLFPPGRHPYDRQAFEHDGGEIIFALPNGLHAYLLVNGKDERIDEGPVDVVHDALRTSGSPAIVTGVSCMACHKAGILPLADTLREGSAVFGEAERAVRRLHPPAAALDDLVKADSRRYLAALEDIAGEYLRAGPDKGRPPEEFAEPVGEVARAYRLGFVDLKTAAYELGLDRPEALVAKVGEKKFKQLGLDALLKEGGVVSRADWEAVNGYSLMQEVAQQLGATPVGD